MFAWGGIHLYRYFVDETFVIRGIYGKKWQNLLLPIYIRFIDTIENMVICKTWD